jgi:hypothetical protein
MTQWVSIQGVPESKSLRWGSDQSTSCYRGESPRYGFVQRLPLPGAWRMATSTAGLTDSGIRRKSGTRIAQRCKAHKGRSGYGTERRGRNGKELGWWVRGRFCVLPPEISLTVSVWNTEVVGNRIALGSARVSSVPRSRHGAADVIQFVSRS